MASFSSGYFDGPGRRLKILVPLLTLPVPRFFTLRNNLMSLRSLVLFVVVLVGHSLAVAAEPTAFFPIMAWDGVPNDLAVLKKMHDCGLTVAGFVPPAALNNCQAAGLKAIVSDPRVGGYDWEHVDAKAARKA